MFSPPRREKARAEIELPKGDCRYILLHPKHQGMRCACVGFALNRSIPGSTCECGHQACYHAVKKETGVVERQEMEHLKALVASLQRQLECEKQQRLERQAQTEELLDKNKTEMDAGFKGVYRDMGGLWHHVGILNKRMPYFQDSIEGLVDDSQRMRSQLIEVDHASIRLEERVEVLESSISTTLPRRRKASTPPSTEVDDESKEQEPTQTSSVSSDEDKTLQHLETGHESSHVESFRSRVSSVGEDPSAWTVHVSLLPKHTQPFPFEKDTAAYKRCLSRGLHQVVVIPDSDSLSFKNAVSEAFANILQGREWQPLVARICDAKNLCGLPMLRQLEEPLLCMDYDKEFLQQNCAVVDESGKILDLYIAMTNDTLSWDAIRGVEPFKPGLEAAWIHDPLLDLETNSLSASGQLNGNADKPAAGDIVPPWSPSLKRSASEISRTPSFGSSTDGENGRAGTKLRRQCKGAGAEIVERRAEAV
ncbi:hypothetical protein HYALB_00009651 [Hymenoscyphus albidus]|uniref:Uncharacterized protein n=1 Tax=Hymenoscyphus albidus TaxID=595503 RepID=A0A9N9LJA9_9HELO|nr:hypothetical protein HYALB_00009651 [Hymenoscyphus albidus]